MNAASATAQKSFDRIESLRKADLFTGLPDAVLGKAADEAVARRLNVGEILCSEHDEASGVYIIVQGRLRSVRQNVQGREQVLSTEGPGAVLAAVPVFNGGKFYSTVIAETVSDVLCIEKRAMHELCREHTELLWNLARVLAHKVRHYAELIETLALRNVDQRVAQYLLTICQERGERNGKACVLELKMTQSELASRVGSTREVICRALAHLEKSGLIQTQGPRLVTILDIHALSRFAGTEATLDEPRLVSELSSEVA
jgi:CRP/FNR family transcriptional regulator